MNSHSVSITKTESTRNPVDYPVLGVLAQGPAHGYDLYQHIRKNLGVVWTLGRSHTYALLARLEREGLVNHELVKQDSRPDKKVFRLTPAGQELFAAWVCAPVDNVRDLRLQFLAKLHFTGLSGPEAEARLVADQLAVFRHQVDELKARQAAGLTVTERRAFDFRLTMVEAAMTWLENCLNPEYS